MWGGRRENDWEFPCVYFVVDEWASENEGETVICSNFEFWEKKHLRVFFGL